MSLKKATRAVLESKNSGGEELELVDYELEDLPDELWDHIRLTRLNLAHNKLKTLSNEVNRIQNLKHLSIFNNSIRELPHLKQSSLETLNCANNKLDCIPAGISTSKLRILDFSINRIKDVPRGVCSVTSLRCLYLSDNDLVTIPSQIGALELLEILSLRDNKITFIPPTIGRLSRLNTLLLQGNKLQFVPKELASCSLNKSDSKLRLAGNPLIPPITEKLKKDGVQGLLKWMQDRPDDYEKILKENNIDKDSIDRSAQEAAVSSTSVGTSLNSSKSGGAGLDKGAQSQAGEKDKKKGFFGAKK